MQSRTGAKSVSTKLLHDFKGLLAAPRPQQQMHAGSDLLSAGHGSTGTERDSAVRGPHATLLHDVHPVIPSGHPEHGQSSLACMHTLKMMTMQRC